MDPVVIIGLIAFVTIYGVKRVLMSYLQVDPVPTGKDFYLNDTHKNHARRVHISMLSFGVISLLVAVNLGAFLANIWVYVLFGYALSYMIGLNIVHIHMYAHHAEQPNQALLVAIDFLVRLSFTLITLAYLPAL